MNIPFTTEQFFKAFRDYNSAIWPAQVAAYLLGLGAVWLALHRSRRALLILAPFWLWIGVVYHWQFFREINPAASLFAALFVAEALLLLWWGRGTEPAQATRSYGMTVGMAAIVFAMVVYPLLGAFLGHGYPSSPGFGVTPCPTTIFTFGVVAMLGRQFFPLLVIPVIWTAVGSVAALRFGVLEDYGMPAFAALTLWALLASGRSRAVLSSSSRV